MVEEGKLVGLVSSGDVLKATIDKQLVLIRDLENFIAGNRS